MGLSHGNHGRRLGAADLLHISGRALMAVGIGWGYLGGVLMLDLGGLMSWAEGSKFGTLALAQGFAIVAVAFGATGARIGYENVKGRAAAREIARSMARRRDEVRRMGGRFR